MSGKIVGYVRVSSVGQKLDRQLDSIGKVDKLYQEKQSAKNITDRPVLQECLDYLRDGDTLVVASSDRLARSLKDLLDTVEMLTGRGVEVRFIKDNLTFPAGGAIDPMSELMLHMLGAVAQFERALIKERQMAGISAAKMRGIKFGRKPRYGIDTCKEVLKRVQAGEKKADLAAELKVSRPTLDRMLDRAGGR